MELDKKMALIRATSDALYRAITNGEIVKRDSGETHRKYTQFQALDIAHLRERLRDLRATLPPLRLVA